MMSSSVFLRRCTRFSQAFWTVIRSQRAVSCRCRRTSDECWTSAHKLCSSSEASRCTRRSWRSSSPTSSSSSTLCCSICWWREVSAVRRSAVSLLSPHLLTWLLLLCEGSGGTFYHWSRGVQIRANLDLLMDWTHGAGLGDLAHTYLLKLSSAVNLLATPKENLLQVVSMILFMQKILFLKKVKVWLYWKEGSFFPLVFNDQHSEHSRLITNAFLLHRYLSGHQALEIINRKYYSLKDKAREHKDSFMVLDKDAG